MGCQSSKTQRIPQQQKEIPVEVPEDVKSVEKTEQEDQNVDESDNSLQKKQQQKQQKRKEEEMEFKNLQFDKFNFKIPKNMQKKDLKEEFNHVQDNYNKKYQQITEDNKEKSKCLKCQKEQVFLPRYCLDCEGWYCFNCALKQIKYQKQCVNKCNPYKLNIDLRETSEQKEKRQKEQERQNNQLEISRLPIRFRIQQPHTQQLIVRLIRQEIEQPNRNNNQNNQNNLNNSNNDSLEDSQSISNVEFNQQESVLSQINRPQSILSQNNINDLSYVGQNNQQQQQNNNQSQLSQIMSRSVHLRRYSQRQQSQQPNQNRQRFQEDQFPIRVNRRNLSIIDIQSFQERQVQSVQPNQQTISQQIQ